jgi:hypothetical protein
MLPFQDQTPSSSSPLVVNNPAAETGEGETQNQALSEETQQGSKKSSPGCKRMLETKLEMLIISKECLSPSVKNSLKTLRLRWSPSLI